MKNLSNKLKNIVRKIDFFGTFISFRVEHDIKYKSLIGGTCTIIYLIIALIYILYMAIPFLKRKDITFTYSNKIVSKNPFVNLSAINFNFAFGPLFLSDAASAIENTTKYFNYKINIVEWVGIDDFFSKEIFFNFCNESDFPSSLMEQFAINELNELYCPIINNNLNYSLDGLYTDDYYKFITIDIFLNEYSKNNFDQVKNFLKENPLLMSFFFIDTAIDYENKKIPLPLYINYVTKDIDFDYIKKSEIFISSLDFVNDDNYFINKQSLYKKVMFDRCEDSFRVIKDRNEEENYNLFQIEIKVSPKVTTLKRKYQKLPEFVASLSGLLSFLLIFIIVACTLIEKKAIDQELIHKMLKFKGNKNINITYLLEKFNEKNEILETNPKKILYSKSLEKRNYNENKINKKIIELFSNINVESIPNVENNVEKKKEEFYTSNSTKSFNENNKKKIKEQKRFLKSENSLINKNTNIGIKKEENEIKFKKLNIFQLIFNVFCFWCSPKLKKSSFLLNQAENKINYYMDIYTYIKIVQEFELLKDLLFDKKSIILFNFLSKTSMKIINNNHFIFSQRFEREFQSIKLMNEFEIDKIYYYYQKMLLDKNNLSKEELKLLEFFKNEINFLKD